MTDNETVLAHLNDFKNCDWIAETYQFRTGELTFEGRPFHQDEPPYHGHTVATLRMSGVSSMRIHFGHHLPTFRFGPASHDGRLNLQIVCEPGDKYYVTCESLEILPYKISACHLTYRPEYQFANAAETVSRLGRGKFDRLVFWEHLSNHTGSLFIGVRQGRVYLLSVVSRMYTDLDFDMRDVSLEAANATDIREIETRVSREYPSLREMARRGEILKLNSSSGVHYVTGCAFAFESFDDLEPIIASRYADARATILGA